MHFRVDSTMKYVKTGRGSGGGSIGPPVSPKVQKERGGGGGGSKGVSESLPARLLASRGIRIMVIIIMHFKY